MSSYRIHTTGPRAETIAAVKATTTDTPAADQTQINAEKAAILSEIGALPPKFTGVRVFAFGDCFPDHSASRREISGYVTPIDSAPLPEPAAPAVAAKPLNK